MAPSLTRSIARRGALGSGSRTTHPLPGHRPRSPGAVPGALEGSPRRRRRATRRLQRLRRRAHGGSRRASRRGGRTTWRSSSETAPRRRPCPGPPRYRTRPAPDGGPVLDAGRGTVSVRGSGLSPAWTRSAPSCRHPTARAAAALVYRHPGGPGHGAAWILRLPEELAAGEYDLTVGASDRSLRADGPIGWPSSRWRSPACGRPVARCAGTERLTVIEGSGFGSTHAASDLRVVWTNGARTLEGTIVFRSDRVLRVLPPGAHHESASQPAENCSVYVLRGRGTATRASRPAGSTSPTGSASRHVAGTPSRRERKIRHGPTVRWPTMDIRAPGGPTVTQTVRPSVAAAPSSCSRPSSPRAPR